MYAAYEVMPDANIGKERLEQGLYIVRDLEEASRVEGKPGMVDHPVEMLAVLTECIDASLAHAARQKDELAQQQLVETLALVQERTEAVLAFLG